VRIRVAAPVLVVQVLLAGWIGVSGAVAQRVSTRLLNATSLRGTSRTFARFAVRQQLLWSSGVDSVAIVLSFASGPTTGRAHAHRRRGLSIGRHSARETLLKLDMETPEMTRSTLSLCLTWWWSAEDSLASRR